MKILQCVDKMDAGGIETLLMTFFRKFVEQKRDIVFDFLVVDKNKGFFDDEIKSLGGQIFYLPPLRYKKPLKIINDFKDRKKYFSQFDGYDVIHIHSSQAFSAYNRAKYATGLNVKKVIVHSHNSSGANVVFNNVYKHKLNKLNIVKLACSEMAGEWMFGKDYTIFYNAINIERFEFNKKIREQMRSELKLNDNFIVGHVGRFSFQKNHEYLLEVFKKLSERNSKARLLLVGSGELENEVVKKIHELALFDKVILCGVRSDVEKLYQAMDVFCFPSRFEGLGIVLVEAQVSGLPCIISEKVPAQVKITDNVKFVGIEKKDIDIWIEQLTLVASSERMSAHGNERFECYNINKGIETLETIYYNTNK